MCLVDTIQSPGVDCFEIFQIKQIYLFQNEKQKSESKRKRNQNKKEREEEASPTWAVPRAQPAEPARETSPAPLSSLSHR
jgi:hypothetical protein